MDRAGDIIQLDRRVSRAISVGKGLRLTDEELDLLVAVGAIEVLKLAAGEALKIQAIQRQRERDEYRALTADPVDKAKMQEAAKMSLQRVQEMLQPKVRVPRSVLSAQKSKRESE
ncbi:hypothetical protein Sj15T_01840 [Sphingobium sp. TA15]|uniref:Uncharacterized protein n=1 Tax=Sphingobium indicum (strain DSM 16413 / CCM 7287 / MTCC 6362 / UT26 / NBRC 101211 / UT26S) TaxID=452662 RepID=D4YZR4_SPHIU|nr:MULTISPECIES: hypothetical protein [Sphingobium]BAI95846.1 hypothetical protein SJA_C1-10120 [Sphingobium indicum UT26S]BDD65163.1 hypothetical protein Sj15T_01840 [Sphingobium sp. TA15]